MEILRVRNSSTGEWEEVPALIGPAGADGQPGADGISPSAKIESTDEGAVITIVDATGESSATLKNGKDGAQGPQGETGPAGADGADGVYVGTSEPIDENIKIWLNPDGAPNSVATLSQVGVVKPDGETITIDEDGTIRLAVANFEGSAF